MAVKYCEGITEWKCALYVRRIANLLVKKHLQLAEKPAVNTRGPSINDEASKASSTPQVPTKTYNITNTNMERESGGNGQAGGNSRC